VRRHLEQGRLGRGRRDPRDRAHLRVADGAPPERIVDERQPTQRPRHANPLARGAQVESDAPVEPVRAGERTVCRPARAFVEAADEGQEPMLGGVDVGGDLGDLVGEAVDVGGREPWRGRRNARGGCHVERIPPSFRGGLGRA